MEIVRYVSREKALGEDGLITAIIVRELLKNARILLSMYGVMPIVMTLLLKVAAMAALNIIKLLLTKVCGQGADIINNRAD
ncbi:hypothetical protein [Desulfotruncus arcticus]|uniref:hypothetical protein n=1 Tax=Desulfotruncus arcticus TaxID=341036 RepID=UPI000B81385C|nr:hypothetical protein [Desulfotruncus arcticus]